MISLNGPFLTNNASFAKHPVQFSPLPPPLTSALGLNTHAQHFVSVLNKKMSYLSAGRMVDCEVLFNLFKFMEQNYHPSIQEALKKEQGYLKRFFSNETWENWLEDQTPLGKVFSTYIDSLENPHQDPTKFVEPLSKEMVDDAIKHALQLLTQVQVSSVNKKGIEPQSQPLWNRLSHLDRAISSWLSFPPTVGAEEVDVSKKKTFWPSPPTVGGQEVDVAKKKTFFSNAEKSIKTVDEALRYVTEKGIQLRSPIPTSCQVIFSFDQVTYAHKLSFTQRKEADLAKEHEVLLQLAIDDDLGLCQDKLKDLFETLLLDSSQYTLDLLHPFSKLFAALLNHSKKDYTFKVLEFHGEKINAVSRNLISKFKNTNDREAVLAWIDVLLMSANMYPKNSDMLRETFHTILDLLRSNSKGVALEKEKEISDLAKLTNELIHPGDIVEIADQILKETGQKTWVGAFVLNKLENLLEDGERIIKHLPSVSLKTGITLSLIPPLLVIYLKAQALKKIALCADKVICCRCLRKSHRSNNIASQPLKRSADKNIMERRHVEDNVTRSGYIRDKSFKRREESLNEYQQENAQRKSSEVPRAVLAESPRRDSVYSESKQQLRSNNDSSQGKRNDSSLMRRKKKETISRASVDNNS